MIRFFKTPWWVKWMYPLFTWKGPDDQSVYLTFDDGPHPEITAWVLNQLKGVNAKATFFCLGKHMVDFPEMVQMIVKEGHAIGSHTYSHFNGWNTATDLYLADVRKCDDVLKSMKIETRLFRPPYGRLRKSQSLALNRKKVVMWSHVAYDFDHTVNSETSINKLKKAKPGSIIVLHDNEKSFQKLKQILPQILQHFRSSGYQMNSLK